MNGMLAPQDGYLASWGMLDPREAKLRMEAMRNASPLAPRDASGVTGGEMLSGIWGSMSPLDKAALVTAPVPVVGDITGLAADAAMYWDDPESRTPGNFALTAGSMLPWVPNAAMFAGILAKTANMDALAKAKMAAAGGDDARDIWRETGWFEGPDGEWRFEIDDSQSEYLPKREPDKTVTPQNLEDAAVQDSFESAYPDMRDLWVGPTESFPEYIGDNMSGAYLSPEEVGQSALLMSRNADKDTLLHELQHAIQEREGFARGGQPALFYPGQEMAGQQGQYEPAYDAYKRLAGEAEARAVQRRMDYTPEQRRNIFPLDDYDVPIDELIVRR